MFRDNVITNKPRSIYQYYINQLKSTPVKVANIYRVKVWLLLKVPVRSNFTNFMFLHFSKVYVVVTYHAKPFFNQSTGSPFFSTVFLAISCPPLIGHVPTAQ